MPGTVINLPSGWRHVKSGDLSGKHYVSALITLDALSDYPDGTPIGHYRSVKWTSSQPLPGQMLPNPPQITLTPLRIASKRHLGGIEYQIILEPIPEKTVREATL